MANPVHTVRAQASESRPEKYRSTKKAPDDPAEEPLPPWAVLVEQAEGVQQLREQEKVVRQAKPQIANRVQVLRPSNANENESGGHLTNKLTALYVQAKLSAQSESERPVARPLQITCEPLASRSQANLSMRPSACLRQHVLPVRLFIASVGNPPPYQTTRHSAGHVLLNALQQHLSFSHLQKDRSYGGGAVSVGEMWTLWQSSSQMNISGVGFLKAYKQFVSASVTSSPLDALHAIVVLHDEMEVAPGTLKLRRGASSPRGHNGIKSVQSALQSAGVLQNLDHEGRFLKVGVGIGRPAGKTRDREDVSAYVLGQLRSEERRGIEESVGGLIKMLQNEAEQIGRVKA